MKKLASSIFFLSIFFGAGLFLGKGILKTSSFFSSSKSFTPSLYPIVNQSFVAVILEKERGAKSEKALRSVLSQNYEPFRVVYVDDGANERHFQQMRDLVYRSGKSEKVQLIQNKVPLGEFQNLVQIAGACKPNEILVLIDEGGFLSHEWVFQILNRYYANPLVKIANGASLTNETFDHSSSPLRTFYASLLTNVAESFALDTDDLSYIEALKEMGKENFSQLNSILYIVEEKG